MEKQTRNLILRQVIDKTVSKKSSALGTKNLSANQNDIVNVRSHKHDTFVRSNTEKNRNELTNPFSQLLKFMKINF